MQPSASESAAARGLRFGRLVSSKARVQCSIIASASEIDVFFGAELPPRAFERVAFLEVRTRHSTDNAALLDELRRSAAACGADAVIAVDKDFAVAEVSYMFVDDEDIEEEQVLTGVAIAFEEARGDAAIHGWDP